MCSPKRLLIRWSLFIAQPNQKIILFHLLAQRELLPSHRAQVSWSLTVAQHGTPHSPIHTPIHCLKYVSVHVVL